MQTALCFVISAQFVTGGPVSNVEERVAKCNPLHENRKGDDVWPKELVEMHQANPSISAKAWSHEDIEQCLDFFLIPNGAHVLEIGANIGRATITISQHAAKVWAHEALDHPFAVLSKNTDAYIKKGIVHLGRAISDAKLYKAGEWDVSPTGSGPEIPTRPVKDVLDLPYDVIVADCEGCFHALVHQTEGKILHKAHTLIYEDDVHVLALRENLIAELKKQGFERVACYTVGFKMPWIEGRQKSDCFYAAWIRKSLTGPALLRGTVGQE